MEDGIIYDPLTDYNSELAAAHAQNTEEFFGELTSKSGVDVESNRATIKKLNGLKTDAEQERKVIGKNKTLRGFLIFCIIVEIAAAVYCGMTLEDMLLRICIPAGCGVLAIISIAVIAARINKKIKEATGIFADLKAEIARHEEEALGQMACLNELFTYGMLEDLVAKSAPQIRVDRHCDNEKITYLRHMSVKNLDETSCITQVRTGVSNGNPFALVSYKDQDFEAKQYDGELTVTWTETVQNSDGSVSVVDKSQTLRASVTKPVPCYYKQSYLYFANDAVPELCFSRKPVLKPGSSEKDVERIVKKGEKELEKLARTAVNQGGQFNKLANSEFEVLFGAINRNNEAQFRMAFTPLAQNNEVKLIKHCDDFRFTKSGRLNALSPACTVTPMPRDFYGMDYDEVKSRFIKLSKSYFHDLYFTFAPLLAIPIYYSEHPDHTYAYCDERKPIGEWEAEALCNRLKDDITPERCDTDIIVRVDGVPTATGDTFTGSATGYAFYGVERVEYVSVRCDNGNYYNVPVPWIDYIPTSKTRLFRADTFKNNAEAEAAITDEDDAVFDCSTIMWL